MLKFILTVSNNHHILSQPLLGVIEFMSIYSFKKCDDYDDYFNGIKFFFLIGVIYRC